MLEKGWGPFKKRWYSICSAHMDYEPDCKVCNVGRWINVWAGNIGSVVYKISPGIWRWFMNTKKKRRKITGIVQGKNNEKR